MRQQASKEYTLWDKELNYVYGRIIKTLSASSRKNLISSELKWIKKRDRWAEKKTIQDVGVLDGGTLDSLLIMSYKTDYVKKRIKWLIRNYAY